jgi:nitroimidazol reductase NimA-like FMN-containing flavoprotein (pyridoxamine 5'-phosphate oxidase superfamily)
MPKLSAAEQQAFLAEPGHLARIATVDADSVPLVVPVWFIAEDGKVFVTPRERSEWWSHIGANPYACIVIDEEARPWRKVLMRGAIEIVHDLDHDDLWREQYRRIACRYVPEREADAYMRNTQNERRALLAMSLEGATTWRMPVDGEDPKGVWASKYYRT